MSLDITRPSLSRTKQYIHLIRLIEYYCSMGILKIWSRLAKAIHCIHPAELFIRRCIYHLMVLVISRLIARFATLWSQLNLYC